MFCVQASFYGVQRFLVCGCTLHECQLSYMYLTPTRSIFHKTQTWSSDNL